MEYNENSIYYHEDRRQESSSREVKMYFDYLWSCFILGYQELITVDNP